MIRLRIKAVAKAQGIKTCAELERFLDVGHSVGERLWKGTPIPLLPNLETYAAKFGCRIEDLYSSTLANGKNGHDDLHKQVGRVRLRSS